MGPTPVRKVQANDIAKRRCFAILTEVDMPAPTTNIGELAVTLLLSVAAGIAWTMIRNSGRIPAPWGMPVLIGSVFVLAFLSSKWFRSRAERKTRLTCSTLVGADVAELAEASLRYSTNYSSSAIATTLAKCLVESSRTATTVRISHTHRRAAVDPLLVPFEPRLLDEADSTFWSLQALALQDSNGSSDPMGDQSEAWAAFRRFVRMSGGWWAIVLISIGISGWLIGAVIEFWQNGRIPRDMFGIYLMLAGVAWGFVYRLFVFKQWLLMPGSLLLRTAKRRFSGNNLHVFDRRSSAMVLFEMNRRVWIAAVADDQSTSWRTMTNKEADMLLRAWLSPIPPPDVNRLTDFQ